MARISIKSGKAKGAGFQKKVRDKILATFKANGFLPDDVRSTSMGQGGEDIQLSPFARDSFNYSVECKKHKSFSIYSVYDQAKSNCGEHEPIVFIEADRREALAVMSMEHFFKLVGDKDAGT